MKNRFETTKEIVNNQIKLNQITTTLHVTTVPVVRSASTSACEHKSTVHTRMRSEETVQLHSADHAQAGRGMSPIPDPHWLIPRLPCTIMSSCAPVSCRSWGHGRRLARTLLTAAALMHKAARQSAR